MRKYTSNKLANLSWICSIFVVLIHATTYAFNLPGAQTGTIYGKNVSTFVQLFLAEGVCRVAVPLFFIFSGYLFFQNFEFTPSCIIKKFKRRIFSLLIPYLFWSVGTFLFFYIAQSIPATAVYFSSRPVVGIGLAETLNYIFVDSLNSPLWYLSDLMILTLLTPVIYVLMKKLWWGAVPVACACGILGYGILTLRGSAICAFALGSFVAIQGEMLKRLWEKARTYNKALTLGLGLIWLTVLLAKSWYLCTLSPDVLQSGQYPPLLNGFALVNIVVGVPAVWLLYDLWAAGRDVKKTYLGQYGMMVYVMHHPVISIVKKVLIMLLGSNMLMSLVCYFASVAITIFVVLGISAVLRRYTQGLYHLISGGR